MSVVHQMGHHSNNLIDLPEMSAYSGAIFSPINCTEAEASQQIDDVRNSRKDFDIILDPQLYVPATQRGKLRKWEYFPKDVDSADLSSSRWWSDLNKKLSTVSRKIKVNSVCSPVVIPKAFDDKFYSMSVKVCDDLLALSASQKVRVFQTLLVNLSELSDAARSPQIASIISRTEADEIYLIFVSSVIPRRELTAVDDLVGAMRLIRSLEQDDLKVTVGFCSSDILLWKTAGASTCASGKFFNLRRFTRQRFEEPTAEGGGQLPYWFEEGLLSFLREGDILRVRKQDLFSEASKRNPFCLEILALIDGAQQTHADLKPWLKLSWRQFLFWFANMEARLAGREITSSDLLSAADANWKKLDKAKVFMEERDNDGTWIRDWLNVITEFQAASH